MNSRRKLTLLLAMVAVGVVGSALFANMSVNKRADEALAEYSQASGAPDVSNFIMVQTSPDEKFARLLDRSSGKLIKGPLAFKARDGGIYAVQEGALVRLSGNLIQNYRIWLFGPSAVVP